MPDLFIGQTIAQYEITGKIGQGGMAKVYKAYQPSIDRYVAIKVLDQLADKDANFAERFKNEAKAIAALEHPHILPVYDFGQQDNLLYLVMRYVDGGTLADTLKADSRPLYPQMAQIIQDVADALDYAHLRGIIHRDVKPSNILIDQHGQVLLADFGLAKVIKNPPENRLTQAGIVVGTATYMSPEQAAGEPLDGRSDVYSLGVILFEMLAGRPPFEAESMMAVAIKHVKEPVPTLRSINPTLPAPFEPILLKALGKYADERYQSAGELSRAFNHAWQELQIDPTSTESPVSRTGLLDDPLTAVLPPPVAAQANATATAAPPVSQPEKTGRPWSQKPWVWAGVGALVTLVVIIGLIIWLLPQPAASLLDYVPKNAKIADQLGRLENRYPRSNYSRQYFEGGMMYWWDNPAGEDVILVIPQAGQAAEGDDWSRYKNTWQAPEPVFPPDCPEAKDPYGPMQGFGKLWCYNEVVKADMRLPVGSEFAKNDASLEQYANGMIFSAPEDAKLWVLFNDGAWQAFEMQ